MSLDQYAAIWVVVTTICLLANQILQGYLSISFHKSLDWDVNTIAFICAYTVGLIVYLNHFSETPL